MEGFAASLSEAATRFAISLPDMGTILVGMATPQQFEDAVAAVQKGPLPAPPSIVCRRCYTRSRASHAECEVDRNIEFGRTKKRLLGYSCGFDCRKLQARGHSWAGSGQALGEDARRP
jgi:hypothetical protein